jgi:hypothetical protein
VIERLWSRGGRDRRRRGVKGERLGGYIYGEIVVLATLVAGAQAYKHGALHIGVLVLVTTVVFWLAHVYADALADSIAKGEHLSWAELREIAGRESSIIEAAFTPVLLVMLSKTGLYSVKTGVWLAFVAGLLVLVTEGFAFARAERLGHLATLVIVGANLLMGLLLVFLKLWVSHH